MHKGLIMALGLLLTASGATAANEASLDAAKQEKKICKTEKVTGSRTRTQRICMTEAQWRTLAEQTNRSLNEMTRVQGPRESSSALTGGL